MGNLKNKISATLIKVFGVRFLTMLGIDYKMFDGMGQDEAIVVIAKSALAVVLGAIYIWSDTHRPSDSTSR